MAVREVLSEEQATSLSLDPKYREQTRREASDVVLLTSRGGRRLDRQFLGSLIRPGIVGNEIERVVVWKNTSQLADWAGKPIRIRFLLQDADFFSFRFEE